MLLIRESSLRSLEALYKLSTKAFPAVLLSKQGLRSAAAAQPLQLTQKRQEKRVAHWLADPGWNQDKVVKAAGNMKYKYYF